MQDNKLFSGLSQEQLKPIDALFLALVLSFVTFIFFAFLRPPFLSDQLDYFYHAWNISEISGNHRHLRVGLIWPAWLSIKVFGYSELSYYFLPLLGALMLSASSWLISRIFFGRVVALFSSILIVCNPYVAFDMAHLLPDYIAGGLISLSIALVVLLGEQGRLRGEVLLKRNWALLGLAGFLLGWSYLAREYVVVLFPVIFLIMLSYRIGVRQIVAFSVPALICWISELVWGWVVFNNPLIRFEAVSSPRTTSREFETDYLGVILQLPDLFLGREGAWLFVFFFVAVLVGGLAFSFRLRSWRALGLWFGLGWLFFTVIAALPMLLLGEDRVFLRMHKFRYWALILPPLVVGGVAFVPEIARYLSTRFSRVIFPAIVVPFFAAVTVVSYLAAESVYDWRGFVRNSASDYSEFRSFMRTQDAPVVWLDISRSGASAIRSVPIYLKEWHGRTSAWDGELKSYYADGAYRPLNELLQEGLVVVDNTRLAFLQRSRELPDYISEPETNPNVVFASSNKKLFVISD